MEESIGDGCSDEPLAPEDPRRKRKAIALTAAVRVPSGEATPVGALGEDLLFEVLRHIDGRSLARAACVSRLWRRTAEDERLWEIMCTREWRYGLPNLRSMVLAQGGFRRLHSRFIAPFTRGRSSSSSSRTSSSFSSSLVPILPSSTRISPTSPAPSSSSSSHSQIQISSSSSFSNVPPTGPSSSAPRPLRWGRDEVLLSLSLLSSQFYFENMGFKKLMDGGGKEDGSNNGGGSSSGGF